MTISWYSISIQSGTEGGEVVIFNGYFSVNDDTTLVTAFYETVHGSTNFSNNLYVDNGYYGEDSVFVNNSFSWGGTNITYMNYYSNPMSPAYNSSYAFFTLWVSDYTTQQFISPLLADGDGIMDMISTITTQWVSDPTVVYVVGNGAQLSDYLNSNSEQCVLTNDIVVHFNLTSSSGMKSMVSDTLIKITRI